MYNQIPLNSTDNSSALDEQRRAYYLDAGLSLMARVVFFCRSDWDEDVTLLFHGDPETESFPCQSFDFRLLNQFHNSGAMDTSETLATNHMYSSVSTGPMIRDLLNVENLDQSLADVVDAELRKKSVLHTSSVYREGLGEAEIHRELIRTFGKFDQVQAIRVGEYLEEIQVFVLLAVKQHDESLISGLLDDEYHIHAKFPLACLYVSYIPIGADGVDQPMYNRGTLIWKRELSRL